VKLPYVAFAGEEFQDCSSNVEDDVLAHAGPINFIPAVKEHLAESCLGGTHELKRLLANAMLANSFGDYGQVGLDWGNKCDAAVECSISGGEGIVRNAWPCSP